MNYRTGLVLLIALCGCGNNPPAPPLMQGPARLRPGDAFVLLAWSVDPDGDSLSYRVNWGDGNESDWSGWFPSGERARFEHTYRDTGGFEVLARARDRELESPLSDPFYVQVREYGPSRPSLPRLAGDTVAVGDSFGVMVSALHPLNEAVGFQFDWSDTLGDWTHTVPAGERLLVRHAYFVEGRYAIRARARDVSGYISDWSDSSVVFVVPE